MSVPADVRTTRAAHCLMKRRPMFMMQGRSLLATRSLRKATHQRQLPQLDLIPIDCKGKSADLPVQQGDGNDLFFLLLLELVFLTITHFSLDTAAAAAAALVVEAFAFFAFPLRLVGEIDAKSDNDNGSDAKSDGFDTSLSFHISKDK